MARFEHLPIYKKAFRFLVIIEEIVMNMQKKSRYTLWADLRNISRNFVVSIARINSMEIKDRKNYVVSMFDFINQIYILLWVAHELKLFQKSTQYQMLFEQIYDIERQLEWWKKTFIT